MLDTSTAAGQAEIADYLRHLAQGKTPDELGIDLAHLPAAIPTAALFACSIPSYGFSHEDFGKRAFDASNIGCGKAGVAEADQEREDKKRIVTAERLDALLDGMSDITDAQKEAMKAYRQTWLNEEHDYGGTKMTGRDIEEMNDRYRNDPRFQNAVQDRLRAKGRTQDEIGRMAIASAQLQVYEQIPEHMLTAEQKAKMAELRVEATEFRKVQVEVHNEFKMSPEALPSQQSHAEEMDKKESFITQRNSTATEMDAQAAQEAVTIKNNPSLIQSAPAVASI